MSRSILSATTLVSVLALTLATACENEPLAPIIDDTSIGLPRIGIETPDEGAMYTGDLVVTPNEDAGDWTLTIGQKTVSVHSPSRADLSKMSGQAAVTVGASWDAPPTLLVKDAKGVLYASSSDQWLDGSDFFGRAVWTLGEVIGAGVVDNQDGEPEDVEFREVVVSSDQGDVILLPGEPTTLPIDGFTYRVTVDAAFTQADNGTDCLGAGLLSIEILRGTADEHESIQPEGGVITPPTMCG